MILPDKLSTSPAFLLPYFQNQNNLIGALTPFTKLEGKNGISITESDTNIVFSYDEPSGSFVEPSATTVLPFQVALDPSAGTDAIRIADGYVVAPNYSSTSTLGGWTGTLTSNLKIWVKINVSGGSYSSAAITTGTTFPSRVVYSSGNQSAFNVRLGEVQSGYNNNPGFDFDLSGAEYHFRQILNTHIQAVDACLGGTPGIIARGGV